MAFIKPSEVYLQWRASVYKPVYLLAGEETYMQEEAWQYLEKKLGVDSLNLEIFYASESSLNDIILAAQTLPFMSERRLLVVKDTQKLRAGEIEKLSEFIKVPVHSSCLVLLWNEKVRKDSRKNALFSAVEKAGEVVDFRSLYENELPAWVQQKVKESGKTISADAVQCLVQESGSNLLDLNNEIEKLLLFTGARGDISAKDVETLSGHTRLANLNHLSDAVEGKRTADALRIIEDLLREGEIPLKILATVARALRRLLAARSLLEQRKSSHQEIRQELHLNAYFDRSFFSNLPRYTRRELENALEKLLSADLELKTSARPEQMIFEELILSLQGTHQLR
ncbi:MAG: DNA polymerase III subunit delta [Endomicrobiales bacterium]